MRKALGALLLLLFVTVMDLEAQNFLLAQEDFGVYVYEIPTKTCVVLDSNAKMKLVGYQLKENRLICYFEKANRVIERGYNNELFSKITKKAIVFEQETENALATPQRFRFEDYLLYVSYLSYGLYKGGKHLSGADSATITKYPGKLDFLSGYHNPQISVSKKSILLEQQTTPMMREHKSLIVEIDMVSGKLTQIGRGKNPSYSPTGDYILCESDKYRDLFYIYDQKTKKRLPRGSLDISHARAEFWLFRSN